MRAIAAAYGHESAFVLPPPRVRPAIWRCASGCRTMKWKCAATPRSARCGCWTGSAVCPATNVTIATLSGDVEARVEHAGTAEARSRSASPRARSRRCRSGGLIDELLSILGIGRTDLAPLPVRNARTSRVKTLIPLKSAAILDGLKPDFGRIEQFCEKIGSTGLYPYAASDPRAAPSMPANFPNRPAIPRTPPPVSPPRLWRSVCSKPGRSQPTAAPSGYGRAGRWAGLREIMVRFRAGPDGAIAGCWLGGGVRFEERSKFPLPGG